MLHSTLPRAYLGYHANYFEDAYAYPYYAAAAAATTTTTTSSSSWGSSPPPAATTTTQLRDTASPLDLSLKRSISNDEIEVEVDDEEDRRARLLLLHCRQPSPDERSSCSSSTHSYHTTPRKSAELWYHPQEQQQSIVYTPQPMTPPSTPSPTTLQQQQQQCSPPKKFKESPTTTTPITPKISVSEKAPRAKKKHVRKLKFDEETSSPVSGTVILGPDEAVVTGDIDPAFNIVEVTEEARAELAKIENRLGPYQCKLCRQLHDDAFQLAQHRCSRIAHVEYRCPECDKRFSCPANLASHRRWHKPRPAVNDEYSCTNCDAKFTKQAALRKHITSQHPNIEQNNNNNNNNGDKFVEGSTAAALAMELA